MKKIDRRVFLKVAGLSTAGLALNPYQVFAATPKVSPYPANFRDVHNSMITIDGAVPLLAGTLNPDHFDLWINGGVTAISLTVGGANFGPEVHGFTILGCRTNPDPP